MLITRFLTTGSGAELLIRCIWAGGVSGWLRLSILALQCRANLVRAAGRGLSRGGEDCVPGCGAAGGCGEADADVEASARAAVDGQGGMVGFGDGYDDGQAQAFVGGGASAGQPLEGLE